MTRSSRTLSFSRDAGKAARTGALPVKWALRSQASSRAPCTSSAGRIGMRRLAVREAQRHGAIRLGRPGRPVRKRCAACRPPQAYRQTRRGGLLSEGMFVGARLAVAPTGRHERARPDLRRRSVRRGVGAGPMRARRSVRSHNAVSTLARRGGDRKSTDCRCAAANLIPSTEPTCRRSFDPRASGCRPCTGRKAAGSSRWGRSCRRGEDRTAPPALRPPEGTRP